MATLTAQKITDTAMVATMTATNSGGDSGYVDAYGNKIKSDDKADYGIQEGNLMAITYKRNPLGTAIDSIMDLVTTIKQQELAQANQLNAMLYQEAKEEKRSVSMELSKETIFVVTSNLIGILKVTGLYPCVPSSDCNSSLLGIIISNLLPS